MSRRLQIAGSAAATTEPGLLADVHAVVAHTVAGWTAAGNTMVGGIGGEPTSDRDPALSIIFDWTVAETVLDGIRTGAVSAPGKDQPTLAVRTSQRARTQIPTARRAALEALLTAGALDLRFLPDTWRSGALIRRAQALVGEVLVIFGGGAGVEDLAELYRASGRPVIPIDVALGRRVTTRSSGAKDSLAGP